MTERRFGTPDQTKAESNLARHGVSFDMVPAFGFDVALEWADERRSYGEERFVAIAPLAGRIHVLVYTLRDGRIRPISLRKANRREIKRYVRFLEE